MTRSFAGRAALVTGAGGDIGRAVATRLAERGATVYVADLRPPAVDGLIPLALDVTDAGAVTEAFAAVGRAAGPVSLLVNAAGGPGRRRTPIDEVSDEDWHRVVSLNLDGTFHCCREAVRGMKSAGVAGSIVNISSGAGRTYSRTGVQGYAAAKAGVIGLTRQLAREAGAAGIRVNCVAPGLIDVEALRDELGSLGTEGLGRHLSGVALGRLGRAEDLVGPILFFLGDEAGYVTGQTISVDGGSIMLG
ncbi:SDR family NAD(P)-dependent oxidoreductase [Amycolatopsis rhabdoformis]|uniref:SDR family NAD(P)-dependent oxidoreductase n=1 Tax=Amycolatopsis rhabdoformis TaxID=1448059 RepID=A0ABZ1IJ78_9PSEU|nr:SDR family NAD(P)-dependent oxidoreductase [Amycolatopsis rhabdoformis]WSE34327.1 SDR family NAD(P)-dependent oxidoreductase [Amycolatopsis rhabdoformis]